MLTIEQPKGAGTLSAGGPFKLLLGGRTTRLDGFLSVDLFDGDNVDIRADVSDLSAFKDGSVSEIYASHVLEHFSHLKTLDVLKEWNRVLAPKGKLYVSVPDFTFCMEFVAKHGLNDWIVNLLWGDQVYALAYHYAPFNVGRLSDLLLKAGFSDCKRISQMPYGLKDCSTLVDTVYHRPVSLSMEAVK